MYNYTPIPISTTNHYKFIEHPFIKKVFCKHCNRTGEVKKGKICPRCRGTGYWLKSLDEKIVSVCESCHGTGYKKWPKICNDCHGYGYTDWLEKIIPREEKWKHINLNLREYELTSDWKIITDYTLKSEFGSTIINELSKNLADSINNEIIEEFTKNLQWTENFTPPTDPYPDGQPILEILKDYHKKSEQI